ncbi:MAG: hypothetical protein AAGH72_04570 [Verrucomicrobiota bacterium]
MYFRFPCAVVLVFMSCWIPVQAKTYDSIPQGRSGANYLQAAFRCWVPETEEPLRGALVMLDGQNGDGRVYTDDKTLRERCEEWNFALVGCYFTGDADHFYSEARRGSGLALENALRDFADQSGKREMDNLPLALIGFSTGAQFAFGMTCFKSNDVIAFVADKGAFFISRPDAGTFETPGLFLVGERDEATKSFENTFKIFKRGKERRALWAMHTEKRQKHEPAERQVQELYLDFIHSVIATRMDPTRPFAKPRQIRADSGVYLNRKTGEITPRDNRKAEEAPDWSWLPDQELALKFIDSSSLTPEEKR